MFCLSFKCIRCIMCLVASLPFLDRLLTNHFSGNCPRCQEACHAIVDFLSLPRHCIMSTERKELLTTYFNISLPVVPDSRSSVRCGMSHVVWLFFLFFLPFFIVKSRCRLGKLS